MRILVKGFSLFLNQIKLFLKVHVLFSLFFALFSVSCIKNAANNQFSVTGLTPTTGVSAGGTLITIKGTNLESTLSVTIGSKACEISSVSSKEIVCTTPANTTGSYDVLVAVNKMQTSRLSAGFTYMPDPMVTSISPDYGKSSGATLVTIVGKEFKEGAIVDFGGASCESVKVISSTTLTCTTTAHEGGTVDVTITNTSNQSGTSRAAFTYNAPPDVSNISPNAGALAGSTSITLTGSNFLSGITVSLGGGSCSDVRVLSSSSLTCTTPAHAAGSVSVTVTNSDAQTKTVAGLYTYQVAPTLTSVSPVEGPLGGGTSVILTGTNFSYGAVAKFNAKPCTSQLILSSTSISCTTPLQFFTGATDVTVTNLDNQVGTLTNGFTYNNPPTITSISPSSGFAVGGTAITITGTGFRSGASIDLGGTSCTGVTVVSETTITCTTAAHAAETVNAIVTNSDNQSGSKLSAYTFQAAPTISSLSLSAGAIAGGTSLTITGTGFVTGASVSIGGSACSSVTVVSSTSITCSTPAHAAGLVSVSVTNSDTQVGTLSNSYTYQIAPTVVSVSPTSGILAGGTSITITGTGFISGASVSVGGSACTGVTVVSLTSITCTTPAHASGAVSIAVTNSDTQSGSGASLYTYNPIPTVTSVSPAYGFAVGGTSVTITGTNFVAGATVSFGGTDCTALTVVSSTSITCTTPAHSSGAVSVSVTNSDTQTSSTTNAYTFNAAPTLTSVSANAGALAGGRTVTLTGTGFVSGATISFGGSACTSVTFVSSTSLTCITPAHAVGSVAVTVTNPDTQTGSAAAAFTYQEAPTVSSSTPSSGAYIGGTTATILGANFLTGATVSFGGNTCSVPVVVDSSTIQCTIPTHMSAGAVDIVVTNSDLQTGTLTNGYIYLAPPTVSAISPNAGALAGGNTVTITGTNLLAGAIVKIDSINCTSVNVLSSTSLTCVTPAHAAGVVDVSVTNTDLQVGTLASSFTYQAAPTVTTLSSLTGALAGGSSITITGTGFVSGASVLFDSSACTSVNVLSSTSLTCLIPAHAAGTVNVTVTNSDTQTATLNSAYIYQPAPTVTSVAPTSGMAAGGTAITITGTGFVSGASASIGGSACTGVTIVNSTTITCTTPAHSAGAVSVSVTNSDTQSGSAAAAYTFNSAPTVTSVSGGTGLLAGGGAMIITGTNFVSGATVSIGGSACGAAVTFNSSTSLTCPNIPGHAVDESVSVIVTNPDTQTGTLAYAYSYGSPTVTNVSLNAGALAGGTSVTITGTNFALAATADFGGSACTSLTVVNSTTITCLTSAHAAGAVTVTVTNANTQAGTAAAAYTYQAAPTVVSVSPSAGALAGGTSVTITGSGFLASATATFGGSSCTGLTVNSATSITCTTPAHIAGPVVVTVTNTDTQSGSTVAYTYQAAPTVTSVSSSTGSIAGDTLVTVSGTGFVTGASVSFDGSNCTSVTIVSSSSLTCRTPAHAAGAVTVSVTNADTQSGSLAAAFTYQSMALLEWQIGSSSPTPPNPDSFGSTSVNVTHTFTLKNTGDIATSTITLINTGGDPAAWLFGTDNCSTYTLAAGASCTVQVTFLGQYLSTGQSYTTTLSASATTGGTTTNTMNASVP